MTIGDELLSGDIENTNATWLAKRLTERGGVVERILVLPDEVGVIAARTEAYAAEFDAVIVTGGIGGTPDDVAMEGVAEGMGVDLSVDPLALADVEEFLAEVADRYPDLDIDARAEATLPTGSRPLLNEEGLSPGCVLENVYVLPGIPSEMKAMFGQVEADFAGDRHSREAFTMTPEGNLIGLLEAIRERFEVTVGCYPDKEDRIPNRIKITASGRERVEEAHAWLLEREDMEPDRNRLE